LALEIEKIIEEIKTLTPKQKHELARRLNEEAVLDNQSWYWTPEWQAAEKKADEDIAAGRVHHFESVDDAMKFLHEQAKRKGSTPFFGNSIQQGLPESGRP